ncbi:hypothetical protein IKG73_03245 [Candidatus Saccharibacteria bacterium]|nr:hypothetical protein [Candidatus Saccharibacteria bacterium]
MKLNLKKLAAILAFSASLFLPAAAFAVDEPGDPPIENNFDGKAYFVWDCNSKVCYHRFEDLKTPEQEINKIENTEITDESGNNGTYVFKQENANWVLAREFADDSGHVLDKWNGKTAREILAPPDDGGIGLNPITFGGGNNSIAVNADWNFQVIIYRDGYKAITVGDSQDDYTYFPEKWMFNYNYFIDISDTSASDPAVVTTYLKEPTIKLKTDGIVSVTPLNVNSGAVTVTPSLNGFDLTFNSSYYDHVVFELKASDGKTYYLMVARTALIVQENYKPGAEPEILVGVMYPSGQANGDTYNVIATVVKTDGSKTVKTVSSGEFYYRVDTNEKVSNPSKVIECGKNLSCSWYSVKTGSPRELTGAYFSVIKNGSTSTTYSGTFSGSNRGAFYDATTRKVIYE